MGRGIHVYHRSLCGFGDWIGIVWLFLKETPTPLPAYWVQFGLFFGEKILEVSGPLHLNK